jgi:hypothetical protein
MTVLWLTWGAAAAAILVLAGAAGWGVHHDVLGVLLDSRGRYSLNRLQTLWWTTIILSLASGVAAARFAVRGSNPLEFHIPDAVLGLMFTVTGTTVAATAVKSWKDRHRRDSVAAANPGFEFLSQVLLQEEGAAADTTIDVSKFQSLVVNLLLGAGYVLTAVHDLMGRGSPAIKGPADITALPDLNATFVTLLALSAGGYVGNKLVPRAGLPAFSVTDRHAAEVQRRAQAQSQPTAKRAAIEAQKQERSDVKHKRADGVAQGDGMPPSPAGPTGPLVDNGQVYRPEGEGVGI